MVCLMMTFRLIEATKNWIDTLDDLKLEITTDYLDELCAMKSELR